MWRRRRQAEQSAEQQAAVELVRLAQEQGLSLTGPDGLLKQLTKTVLETALNEEMTEHLGYEKHDPAGAGTGNIRNGTRAKTVLTDTTGHVEIDVPRDRAATFEPQIVRKRQRRLSGVDEVVLSLYAKGLTTGEITAHFAEIYGASVSKETISRITDKVIEEMNDWAVRPLDDIYAAIFIDAIVVKVRDGQVANRPFYAAIGVTLAGERDILGLWAGTGGEGAKFWMSVLTDLRNRGVKDVVLRGLRRPQGPARGGRQRLAAGDRADLHHPLDPQHLPAHLPQVLGRDQTRHQTDLHRGQRRRGPGGVRRAGREVGAALPGGDPAVGQRLGRVHPVPGLRRGDPPGHLLHERDRVPQRPLPAGDQGPRPLPVRAGRAEVSLPGDPISGPDRCWAGHDGRCGGSQRSTRSRSPSATASRQPKPTELKILSRPVDGLFQATSVSVDSARRSAGVMSMGRSSSLPLWNTAPARTSATRCGALTARQRAWAASISL